jgi:lipoyl(octanoyl) transferase
MEQGIMDYLSVVHALPVCRREGFTGVWTPGYDDPSGPPRRKISAMGISCRRWVTAHGFALNFHPDLEVFRSFVPCGITDAPTTSLQFEQALVGRQYLQQPMKEVVQQVHQFLCRALAQQGWTA